MTRRRFIQIPGQGLVEVTPDYVSPDSKRNTDAVLWNDTLYQNDGDPRYNSRSEHRQYMKANDLAMVDDFKGHFASKAAERANFYQGIDPDRKHDVARAVEQLSKRR